MPLLSRRSIECDSTEFGTLAQAILDEGLTLRFRAKGMSMHPFVRNGDLLHVRAVVDPAAQVGDVITNQAQIATTTHDLDPTNNAMPVTTTIRSPDVIRTYLPLVLKEYP
jgi:hypothetical protein